ncbi:MAG: transposase [Candidatus Lokiarchaeota archaeon]|nr:transposase [Candidatus Lokiarchaeota archaeon]
MSAITITRTFALLPNELPYQSYKEMTNLLVKERALKNRYTALMIADIKENSYHSYKSTSISRFRQAVYDRLNFSQVLSSQFQKLKLKERAKQCAFYDAYLSVREWIKRVENLKRIIGYLTDIIRKDRAFTLSFLRGKRFRSETLKEIKKLLRNDCFGKRQDLSNDFLNNYILQVRNLFLSCNDFGMESLYSEYSGSNALQAKMRESVQNLHLTDDLIGQISTGFHRTKKGKRISVIPSDLTDYMVDCYIRQLQWITTRKAQQILSLKKKIKQEQEKKKKTKLSSFHLSLDKISTSLSLLIGEVTFSSQHEFKKKRALILKPFRKELKKRVKSFEIDLLIQKSFESELLDIKQHHNQYVLRRLFKPHFPKIPIDGMHYDAFITYFTTKLQYKIRELLKEEVISEQIISLMNSRLQTLKEDILSIIAIPHHKMLSLSVINRDVYKEYFGNKEQKKDFIIKLGLLAHQFKTFKIKDEKGRIKQLLHNHFIPALPRISLKNRKLLLHLPFQTHKKDCSKPSLIAQNCALEMGIDLGLKHLAVLSIWNKEQNKEIARYFLGTKQLFDMKFNHTEGTFNSLTIPPSGRTPSNIKIKLIRLREQIKALQKKKNNYEQRLLQNNISNYRKKLNWNKIRRTLSLCWERLHRLHYHVVHLLSHAILSIATYYNISTIKVEDLRWASHSRKKDAGKYLSFWQTHWFYSQIQTALQLQCQLHSIQFQKVSARNTSKICSCCGTIGIREGKHFKCSHCGFRLDSDLNASRNIVKRQKNYHKIPPHIDIPYMGCQDLQLQVNKEDVHKYPDF